MATADRVHLGSGQLGIGKDRPPESDCDLKGGGTCVFFGNESILD